MKTIQATRQHRRVVWITVQFFLVLGVFFVGGRLFLLRSSLLAAAPENTDLAFTLVGEKVQKVFFERFGNEPVVVQQALRFSDIRPYVGRELALFFDLDSGKSSVVFQGTLPDEVQSQWKSYGLFIKESSGTTMLANQTIQPFDKDLSFGFSSVLPNYAGMVRVGEEQGTLFLHKDGVLAKVHTGVDKPEMMLQRTEASLAFVPIEWSLWTPLNLETSGAVSLAADESGIAYTIQLDQKLDSQSLAKIVQRVALSLRPMIETHTLPDQGTAREIRLNEEQIDLSIEEMEPGVRVVARKDDQIVVIGWTEWEKTFITNREALMTGVTAHESTSLCLKSASLFLLPKKMSSSGLFSYGSTYQLGGLLKNFEELAISKEKMKFCW